MSVIVLQVFVSLLLVAGSVVLFVFSVRQKDFEHTDRLALTPLDEDIAPAATEEAEEKACTPSESPTTTR